MVDHWWIYQYFQISLCLLQKHKIMDGDNLLARIHKLSFYRRKSNWKLSGDLPHEEQPTLKESQPPQQALQSQKSKIEFNLTYVISDSEHVLVKTLVKENSDAANIQTESNDEPKRDEMDANSNQASANRDEMYANSNQASANRDEMDANSNQALANRDEMDANSNQASANRDEMDANEEANQSSSFLNKGFIENISQPVSSSNKASTETQSKPGASQRLQALLSCKINIENKECPELSSEPWWLNDITPNEGYLNYATNEELNNPPAQDLMIQEFYTPVETADFNCQSTAEGLCHQEYWNPALRHMFYHPAVIERLFEPASTQEINQSPTVTQYVNELSAMVQEFQPAHQFDFSPMECDYPMGHQNELCSGNEEILDLLIAGGTLQDKTEANFNHSMESYETFAAQCVAHSTMKEHFADQSFLVVNGTRYVKMKDASVETELFQPWP